MTIATSLDSQSDRDMPVEPPLSSKQTDSDEADLVAAVRGLADLAANTDDLDGFLQQIAELTVMSVPGADGAGITVVRRADAGPREVLAWAATDPFVREVDHLQFEVLGEGPCLTAIQTRRALVSGSVGSDQRWRRLGGRIARLNVHAALAIPLIGGDAVVGALNIYAHTPDSFTEHAVSMAARYAQPAAVAVANMQALQAAHTEAVQLQTALTSRAIIDQAIGILRGRTGASEREALDQLRHVSQTEDVKLAVVAGRMVNEAVRRARARNSTAGGA